MSATPATSVADPPRLHRTGGVAVVEALGTVDAAQEEALRRLVDTALCAGAVTVVLDISRALLVPASRALLSDLHDEVATRGSRFAVAGPTGPSREVLDPLRVELDLLVYPVVPAAPPWSDAGPAVFV